MKLIKGKYYKVKCQGKLKIGRYIGSTDRGNPSHFPSHLFEFLEKIPSGHDGNKALCGIEGRDGFCWYLFRNEIISRLSTNDAIIEVI
jgi:hypothetical protein